MCSRCVSPRVICSELGDKNEDEIRSFFKFLKSNRVGVRDAVFYLEWARFERSRERRDKCEAVLKSGMENRAQPLDLLERALTDPQDGHYLLRGAFLQQRASAECCEGEKENAVVNKNDAQTMSHPEVVRSRLLSNPLANFTDPNDRRLLCF